MINIKLTATKGELKKALGILKQKFKIISVGNAIKNRNSPFCRTYVTVDFLEKESE